MPFLGMGLHIIVAICFAVHAVRSGQDRYWLMVLFMFPLLGSLVYALAIWLPSMRYTQQGRAVSRGVERLLNPGRELREAQDAYDIAATVDNRLRLADALVGDKRPAEAIEHYRNALRGIHSDDPDIHVRLGQALLESGRPAEARQLLDDLIKHKPDFRSAQGHLVYARAVAAEGNRDKAKEEFETLIGYSSGFEAQAYYAQALVDWGERERAQAVCDGAMKQAKRLPGYARRMNKDALDRLKRLGKNSASASST